MPKNSLKYLSLVSQIGITVVTAILLGTVIGFYLDQWLETRGIFTVVFIILGSASGVWAAYQLLVKLSLDDLDK